MQKNETFLKENEFFSKSIFRTIFSSQQLFEDERYLRANVCGWSFESSTSFDKVGKGYVLYSFNIYCCNSKNLLDFEKQEPMICIFRRFSDFEFLSKQLAEVFPGYIFPPMPEKSIKTKIQVLSDQVASKRAILLTFFLNYIFLNKEIRESQLVADFIQKAV